MVTAIPSMRVPMEGVCTGVCMSDTCKDSKAVLPSPDDYRLSVFPGVWSIRCSLCLVIVLCEQGISVHGTFSSRRRHIGNWAFGLRKA